MFFTAFFVWLFADLPPLNHEIISSLGTWTRNHHADATSYDDHQQDQVDYGFRRDCQRQTTNPYALFVYILEHGEKYDRHTVPYLERLRREMFSPDLLNDPDTVAMIINIALKHNCFTYVEFLLHFAVIERIMRVPLFNLFFDLLSFQDTIPCFKFLLEKLLIIMPKNRFLASINLRNRYNHSPLFYYLLESCDLVTTSEKSVCVDLFIQYGADITGSYGNPALYKRLKTPPPLTTPRGNYKSKVKTHLEVALENYLFQFTYMRSQRFGRMKVVYSILEITSNLTKNELRLLKHARNKALSCKRISSLEKKLIEENNHIMPKTLFNFAKITIFNCLPPKKSDSVYRLSSYLPKVVFDNINYIFSH